MGDRDHSRSEADISRTDVVSRGRALVTGATLVILMGPVRTFSTQLDVPLILTIGVTLAHLSFVALLVFVLWTGTPMFRYWAVAYLTGAALFALPTFLF